MTKTVADSERPLVVTYNPRLTKTQEMTLQKDLAKANGCPSSKVGWRAAPPG